MIIQQKCPICEGHGIVPDGFYRTLPRMGCIFSAISEKCRNCQGIGVVFVTQSEEMLPTRRSNTLGDNDDKV